jgi:predicted GNAT superfamily acetyltransferase
MGYITYMGGMVAGEYLINGDIMGISFGFNGCK